MNIFKVFSKQNKNIAMVTCYDAAMARCLNQTAIDAVLVGDSVAMVCHGFETTVFATLEMMELHTAAVARVLKGKPIVADVPFLSTRKDLATAVDACGRLVRAGAHAVKIEGMLGHESLIPHLVESGIPVMAHLGLQPQSVLALGGHTVQGRGLADADRILSHAKMAEQLGCFALVLECVPESLARRVTESLGIPVIGIGAGSVTDGQILVLHDLLGLFEKSPRFVRQFGDHRNTTIQSVQRFVLEVKEGSFPNASEGYADAHH